MMLRSLILILAILPTFAAENIKAVGAVSKANIKSVGAVAEANIKAVGAVDNTASGGPASAADTFDRTDAAPISSPGSDGVITWVSAPGDGVNNVDIVSNRADGTGSDSFARISSPNFAANQEVTITIASTSSVGAAVRMNSNTDMDCYFMYLLNTTTVQLYQVTDNQNGNLSGDIVQIGANITVTAMTVGDTLTLRVTTSGGNAVLTVYRNGVQSPDADNPHTDSSAPILLSGNPGILCDGASANIQAVTATDI